MAANTSVLSMMADIEARLNTSQVQKDWKAAQDKIATSFSEMVGDAVKEGFKPNTLVAWGRSYSKIQDQVNRSRMQALDAERRVMEAIQKGEKASAEKLDLARAKRQLQQAEALSRKEFGNMNRLMDRRKKANEELERRAQMSRMERMEEAGEKFGDTIAKSFDDLKSFNIGGILGGLGKGMAAKGEMMKAQADKGGAMSGMMGSVGGLLAKIGPAVAAVAGIAAGIGAVVKIILDADSKAKELNRTLIDGGVGAAELADQFGNISDSLDVVRTSATNLNFNKVWGTTAKDHIEVLRAYSEAGVSFREMTLGAKDAAQQVKILNDYTRTAVAYSKLLGASQTEIADTTATWMEELGMNLQNVQEGFSSIRVAAQDSGFSTKRFFNMVLQATTGMSMYNVRVEEAAGLLVQLSGILGQKMGGDFLQNLTKGFMDEGMQARFKRVLTTGTGKMKEIYGKTAERTAASFMGKVKGKEPQLAGAAAAAGVKLDTSSAAALAKSVGSLLMKERTGLVAQVRKDLGDDVANQLVNLAGAATGAKGGLGGMAQNLGALDMGGKLAAKLAEGNAVIGVPLHEMNAIQQTAFENITGVSGEQLEQLKRVSMSMSGQFNELKKIRDKGIAQTEEEKKASVKAWGAYVENGKIIRGALDETGEIIRTGDEQTIEDLGDYIQGQGDAFKEIAKKGVPEDIDLARQVADNTTEMSKILEQGVEYFLEKIYQGVEYISNILGAGGLDEGQKAARADAMSALSQQIEDFGKQARLQEDAVRKLKVQMERAPEEEKGKIQEEITKREELSKKLRISMVSRREMMGGLRGIRSQDDMKRLLGDKDAGKTAEEMMTAAGRTDTVRSMVVRTLTDEGFGGDIQQGMKAAGKAAYDAKIAEGEKEAQRILEQARTSLASVTDVGYKEAGMARAEDTARRAREHFRTKAEEAREAAMTSGATLSTVAGLDMGAAGTGGLGQAAETLSGPLYLKREGQKERREDTKDKRQFDKEQTAEDKRQDKLLDGLEEIQEKQDIKKVAEILIRSGQVTDVGQAVEAAKSIVQTGRPGSIDLSKKFTMTTPSGQVIETNLGTQLAGIVRPEATKGVQGVLGPAPPAQDFLMHIGEGGRVKFAQRIDAADTVTAVASKPGGALSRAGAGGGGVVNNHFYNDGQGIFASMKRWQQANGSN